MPAIWAIWCDWCPTPAPATRQAARSLGPGDQEFIVVRRAPMRWWPNLGRWHDSGAGSGPVLVTGSAGFWVRRWWRGCGARSGAVDESTLPRRATDYGPSRLAAEAAMLGCVGGEWHQRRCRTRRYHPLPLPAGCGGRAGPRMRDVVSVLKRLSLVCEVALTGTGSAPLPTAVDNQRAARDLGFAPATALDQGLRFYRDALFP